MVSFTYNSHKRNRKSPKKFTKRLPGLQNLNYYNYNYIIYYYNYNIIFLVEPDHVIAKFDFTNAFNTLRRDNMLEAIKHVCPEVYNFCRSSYESKSMLFMRTIYFTLRKDPSRATPWAPLCSVWQFTQYSRL